MRELVHEIKFTFHGIEVKLTGTRSWCIGEGIIYSDDSACNNVFLQLPHNNAIIVSDNAL